MFFDHRRRPYGAKSRARLRESGTQHTGPFETGDLAEKDKLQAIAPVSAPGGQVKNASGRHFRNLAGNQLNAIKAVFCWRFEL